MLIRKTGIAHLKEPYIRPFGFKGGHVTSSGQAVVRLESEKHAAVGLATQSILWSDAAVFFDKGDEGGKAAMLAVTEYAVGLARGRRIEHPMDFQEEIFEDVHRYARKVTGRDDLRKTFTLNALVSLDNALWVLLAAERGRPGFLELVPAEYRAPLSFKHPRVACIPLISYNVPVGEIESSFGEGFFIFKIKIGSDPDQDGDREKMLRWDMERVSVIHEKLSACRTPFTESGRIPYYFDANGRYDSPELLERMIEHLAGIGALEQVIIIEEPFPEEREWPVSGFPAPLAADESAHTVEDTRRLGDLGYRAVALKPIAKTLSMTLRILREAHERGMEYFCADLTVIPPLVDWNKNMAARLKPLPGLKIPAFESNGAQNYRDWERLMTYLPFPDAGWVRPEKGVFELGEDFYRLDAGIFENPRYYLDLASVSDRGGGRA